MSGQRPLSHIVCVHGHRCLILEEPLITCAPVTTEGLAAQTPRAEGPLGAQILGRCHRHEPPLVLDAAPLDLFVR